MGIGSARGADRAIKAAELAVASPLLEASIDGAHGVLISIQGGSNLGIFEINDAAKLVQEAVHPEANIIFGTVIDDTLGDEVRVTVIAAGFDGGEPIRRPSDSRRSNFVIAEGLRSEASAAQSSPVVATAGSAPSWQSTAAQTAPMSRDGSFGDEDGDELDIPDFLNVQSTIADAVRSAGRREEDITTIVVTKFHPVSTLRQLHSLGLRDFGENRHQEATVKASELSDLDIRWNFIGQLQSNKAKSALEYASVIHSLDRLSLVA
eukprot:gene52818-64540_t